MSRDSGDAPRWLADGRIVYLQGGRAVARRVDPGAEFRVSEPVVMAQVLSPDSWDISPDGEFFVVFEEPEPPRLVLITDWFAELERLLPR